MRKDFHRERRIKIKGNFQRWRSVANECTSTAKRRYAIRNLQTTAKASDGGLASDTESGNWIAINRVYSNHSFPHCNTQAGKFLVFHEISQNNKNTIIPTTDSLGNNDAFEAINGTVLR